MNALWADVRFAIRMLKKSPGFTIVAVAALALGIGANIAIFTVVNAVMLNPLPYPQPERIMRLGRAHGADTGYSNSIPKYFSWRQNQAFESMALYDFGSLGMNLGTANPPDQVKGTHVSADYLKVFGVAPQLGRSFNTDEDRPGGPPVVVISYSVWQARFSGDPSILKRTILLNGAPYSVVGVLPSGLVPERKADLFLPIQADPNSTNQGHYLMVAGRLRPGVSLDAARAELKAGGERFRQQFPHAMDKTESVGVVPMREALVSEVRVALLVLLGAVALVLLIACANVANLLLVRAAVRQRELAIRTAVGAARSRVIRQLLTESIVLAGLGAIFGFALGAWGVRFLLSLVPGNIPRLTEDGVHTTVPLMDGNVVLFTIGVTLLTALIFGPLPAMQASKADISGHLKEASGRSGTGKQQNRIRSLLVIVEVALALILLVGAGLLMRTFVGLQNVNPGIDSRNVLTLETSLSGGSYGKTAAVANLAQQAIRRIEALPGVVAATSTIVLPIEGGVDLPFDIVGKTPSSGDHEGDAQWRSISPHYFDVFRIPLLRGRAFAETDAANTSKVVIINQALAKRYWKEQDPLGQMIVIGKGVAPQFEEPPRQVVGIVGNVRENGLQNKDIEVLYVPQSQVAEGITAVVNSVVPLAWAFRTAGEPMLGRVAIQREMLAVDGMLPFARERTMQQVIETSVARQKFNSLLLSIFAGIALILAAIGIYGLMAYSVEQRSQELGVRIALGASAGQIRNMVMRRGLLLALAGIVTGLTLAYALTRLLASLLFGVSAADPLVFAGVAAAFGMIALVAAYIPATRAATISPATALRSE